MLQLDVHRAIDRIVLIGTVVDEGHHVRLVLLIEKRLVVHLASDRFALVVTVSPGRAQPGVAPVNSEERKNALVPARHTSEGRYPGGEVASPHTGFRFRD